MRLALIPSLVIAACTWFRLSAAQHNKVLEDSGANLRVCKDSSSGSCTIRGDEDQSSIEEAVSVLLLQEKLQVLSSRISPESEDPATGNLTDVALPLKLHPEPKYQELPANKSSLHTSPGPAKEHKPNRIGRIAEMVADALVTEVSPARADPLSDLPMSELNESENQKPLPKGMIQGTLWFSYFCCAIYSMCIIKDLWKIFIYKESNAAASLLQVPDARNTQPLGRPPPDPLESTMDDQKSQRWSVLGIWGLCFYRVYTGFLAATWLPYVLAMEGGALWPEDQSLFMGCCKLIYGLTVLANPLCGLLGDKMAEVSRGAARRLWILFGIIMSAAGIMICLYAGPAGYYWYYIFGVTVWRIGEALNDVTTEAIIPEMVPPEQFEVASAVKASSFLFGGLTGYSLVYVYAHIHYSWCYYAYLVCMFLTAIPSLLLLSDDSPLENADPISGSLLTQMVSCYTTPMSYDGGFPECSLAIFTMACGTAPFFFTLLIIRDLIGIHNIVTLQHYFAITCLAFFTSAAVAASYDVAFGGRIGPNNRQGDGGTEWEEQKKIKLNTLVNCALAYAFIVVCIPVTVLIPFGLRLDTWYFLTVWFGALYGFGISRSQDATWRLLPQDVDMANAMGFNVMCRNFGLGVGNFVAGCVLDRFQLPDTGATTSLEDVSHATERQMYSLLGYCIMCLLCAFCNISCAYLVRRISFNHVKIPALPAQAG